MPYSKEFIEKIKKANNLFELISEYTQLTQRGKNYIGNCPFPYHEDKTESFAYNPELQIYRCFGVE